MTLSVPLRTRIGAAAAGDGAEVLSGAGVARSRMSLLGLLHYLWERAELTTWEAGGPRLGSAAGWAGCSPPLQAATAGVSSSGLSLSESCYVIPPFDPAAPDRHRAEFERFTARLSDQAGMSRRAGAGQGAVRGWV